MNLQQYAPAVSAYTTFHIVPAQALFPRNNNFSKNFPPRNNFPFNDNSLILKS